MFGAIDRKVARAGKTAALGLGAGLLLIAGLAFLTVAAWITLATAAGALTAATVVGAVYLGAGCIMLAIALTGRDKPDHATANYAAHEPEIPSDTPPLMAAFMHGMNAGARTASRHH